MKRLLCILSSMNRGGAETFLMKIYRVINRSKYQIDFCINCSTKCDYEDEIVSLGGKIFRIPSKSQSIRTFKKRLYSIVKENDYKYVLRITSNAAGFLDLKIAKKAGACHTIARSSNSSDGDSLKAKLAHLLGRFLWSKYVDTMIAPSDLAAIYTFGKYNFKKGKVIMLHNGLDLDFFKYNLKNRIRIRKELNVDCSTIVLGHVGRFSKQKNHSFLIDIFSKYHSTNSNSVLVLTGDGETKTSIEQKTKQIGLKESVLFLGVREDIPALLSAFDVLIFPSLYEGMPNVVIEAQANGLQCLISETITKEVDVSGNVIFLPLNNVDNWTNELDNLTMSHVRGDEIKEKMKDYDIKNCCASFIKCVFEYEQ